MAGTHYANRDYSKRKWRDHMTQFIEMALKAEVVKKDVGRNNIISAF
ncbi:hypothetical protein [Caldithrix abyssi]